METYLNILPLSYFILPILLATMAKTKISITINEKTLQDIDSIIDNVYIRNRSQATEHLVRNALGENKTAIILLGGNEEHLKISKEGYRPTAKIKNNAI